MCQVNQIGSKIIDDGVLIPVILLVGKNSTRKENSIVSILDDEDTLDDQEEIKLSSTRKSHLTINEHERFSKEKQSFKTKYNQQIDEVKHSINPSFFIRSSHFS